MGFIDQASRPGDELRAADVNEIKSALRGRRVSAGQGSDRLATSGGTLVRDGRRRRLRAVKTGASGIPAASADMLTPGSATARAYDFDGTTFSDSGNDVTAFNAVPTAVGANKICLCEELGVYLFVLVEPC